MTGFVSYLLLFLGIAVFFIFFHLMLGKLIRPIKPDPEKLTIYECGEPTIGSAWIQFDLRFYVVALLFVIFDVEVAFFFPWAVVFGNTVRLAQPDLPASERAAITRDLDPTGIYTATSTVKEQPLNVKENRAAAETMAWIAFFDILVFFGVLLVGFAYLWKRGDLDWVRTLAAERAAEAATRASAMRQAAPGLVEAGR